MGAYRSKLTPEEVEELQSSTHFTSREIEVLYRRFKKLDRKRAGYITRDEFHLIPELSMNPLCDRLIGLFDPTQSEQVTFDMFVNAVNLFSPHAPLKERMKAVFQVYDVDGDGRISAADLHALLHCLVGDNLDGDMQRAIVQQTLQHCGKPHPDDTITLEDFEHILGPEIANLIIPIHTND